MSELPPDIPLGKPTSYPDGYDASLLVPIERAPARRAMGLGDELPFQGEDVWNGYEFSWLTPGGLPRVACLRLTVDAGSPRIVESKSMKLYLNGYASTAFDGVDAVRASLTRDLGEGFGAPVAVALRPLDTLPPLADLPGASLDDQDGLTVSDYQRNPDLLPAGRGAVVHETVHTHLFRSLCPVTGQPDWASILIRYQGPAMDRAALLRYLVSYRNHQAFHEATVEQIFLDLKLRCACEHLLVAGYFLRRGGLDINPYRADPGGTAPAVRLARQ